MRLRRQAAWAAALAALCALVAAPAWSVLAPPPARSFDLPLSLADVLTSDKRFNMVGLQWRGQPDARVALRVRRGGDWGPWMHASRVDSDQGEGGEDRSARRVVTDPVWVGEAEALEVRADRSLPGLRAAFENTTGTATAGDRARTAMRDAAVAGLALIGVADAEAADTAPDVVPRSEWERGECTPRRAPAEGAVRAAFVHHTADGAAYTRADSPDVVLAMCRYHRNSNRWNDLGYNFVVDAYGQVFEGRAGGVDRPVIGAHAQGWNSHSTGIAVIGSYGTAGISEAAAASLSRLLAWKLALHGVRPDDTVVLESAGGSANRYPAGEHVRFNTVSGHRDGDSTACPGSALYAQLPELRRRAAQFDFPLGAALGPEATLDPGRGAIAYRGRLELAGKAPRGSAGVTVEYDRGGRWRELEKLTSAPDGTFKLDFRVGSTHRYRAVFDDRPGPAARVQVRPRIATLFRGARRIEGTRYAAGAGERLRFYSRITPMKSRIVVRAERIGEDGNWHTVVREVVDTERGRAWASFRLDDPGLYRVRSLSFGDSRHASGRSHIRTVEVTE
ncbi:MAG: peptidoglycan recognition protein [Thermoleophilaceae bacterium]